MLNGPTGFIKFFWVGYDGKWAEAIWYWVWNGLAGPFVYMK